jgi:hypothetical protein
MQLENTKQNGYCKSFNLKLNNKLPKLLLYFKSGQVIYAITVETA